MTTQIEARRLSAADIGKTITITGERLGEPITLTGTLDSMLIQRGATPDSVTVEVNIGQDDGYWDVNLAPLETVTITGKPSPVTGPDCKDNKHPACDARALDEATDEITRCQCTCHA